MYDPYGPDGDGPVPPDGPGRGGWEDHPPAPPEPSVAGAGAHESSLPASATSSTTGSTESPATVTAGRQRRRQGRHRFGAAALAVAVVAGGGAGALTARLVAGPSGLSVSASPSASAVATSANSGTTIADLVARVEPALVDITATGTSGSTSPLFGDGLDPFGGQTTSTEEAGTGMILTSDGLVLTNAHVIAGATRISVVEDGQTTSHPARLVGEDAKKDVALIQIEGVSGLPTVTLGNSAGVVPGDSVLAIGNALDLQTGGFSVSNGIISGLDRSISTNNGEHLTGMLQTDAAISSGDSGGPLVNSAGEVIGMDTATATSTSVNTAQDIGFSIPVNEIRSLIPTLEKGNIGTPTFGATAGSGASSQSPGYSFGFGSSY